MSDLGISAARAYMQTAQTLAGVQSKPAEGLQGAGFGDILNTAVSTLSKAATGAEGAV